MTARSCTRTCTAESQWQVHLTSWLPCTPGASWSPPGWGCQSVSRGAGHHGVLHTEWGTRSGMLVQLTEFVTLAQGVAAGDGDLSGFAQLQVLFPSLLNWWCQAYFHLFTGKMTFFSPHLMLCLIFLHMIFKQVLAISFSTHNFNKNNLVSRGAVYCQDVCTAIYCLHANKWDIAGCK